MFWINNSGEHPNGTAKMSARRMFDWSVCSLRQTAWAWHTSGSRRWSAPLPDLCSSSGRSLTPSRRCWSKSLLGSSADVYWVSSPHPGVCQSYKWKEWNPNNAFTFLIVGAGLNFFFFFLTLQLWGSSTLCKINNFLYSPSFCRGDEGIPASYWAGRQRLSLCRLQAQEWPFWCDHCRFDKGNNRKGIPSVPFFVRCLSGKIKWIQFVFLSPCLLKISDVLKWCSVFFVWMQGCHCLLDIAPHAIERLHSVHIYPIVVFVRYKNAKQIK